MAIAREEYAFSILPVDKFCLMPSASFTLLQLWTTFQFSFLIESLKFILERAYLITFGGTYTFLFLREQGKLVSDHSDQGYEHLRMRHVRQKPGLGENN